MKVRIYKPAKTAMQSGWGKTKEWLLESEPAPKILDPLMGWTGSRDTMQQVQLQFSTLDEARPPAVGGERHGALELRAGELGGRGIALVEHALHLAAVVPDAEHDQARQQGDQQQEVAPAPASELHGPSFCELLARMARPAGFEPAAYRLEGGCSNPLSYGRPSAG